jgi:hypothetical protein
MTVVGLQPGRVRAAGGSRLLQQPWHAALQPPARRAATLALDLPCPSNTRRRIPPVLQRSVRDLRNISNPN